MKNKTQKTDNTKKCTDVEASSVANCYMSCPNCGTLTKVDDFNPSFRYATLIECPECIKKVRPNNVAKISDIPNMF